MRRVHTLTLHLTAVPAGSEGQEAVVTHPGVAHYSSPKSGARTLIRTLVKNDCTVCFTNPGTSEMHFVAGLDSEPEMRPILVLQENVATGAADAYARMTGKPASTLLHLAPGMANGYANLHNARKNNTPMINIIGDHATFHKKFDAPLNSDIEALSESLKSGTQASQWYRTTGHVTSIVDDACDAVVAAGRGVGQISTLILPADVSWADDAPPARKVDIPARPTVPEARIAEMLGILRDNAKTTMLVVGGMCVRDDEPLIAADTIRRATGCRLGMPTFTGHFRRGGAVPTPPGIPYFPEDATKFFAGTTQMVLVESQSPCAFFAYPGEESSFVPPGCTVTTLCGFHEDGPSALEQLAAQLTEPAPKPPKAPRFLDGNAPTGELTAFSGAKSLVMALPTDRPIILADESNTAGLGSMPHWGEGPAHDVLKQTGGAIGIGLTLALGSAIACPEAKVVCCSADGSTMYCIQSLWTMARENCNILIVIIDNGAYAILQGEMSRMAAAPMGLAATNVFDLTRPALNFVHISEGMGVPATMATTAEEFHEQVADAMATEGPRLIHMCISGSNFLSDSA